jgi:uncharacterized protein YmfQ (DUF2313 family)
MPAPRPQLAEWLQATIDLLPQGEAWSRDPASNLAGVMGVIAAERKARHDRKLQLLEIESFPTRSAELLPEWERTAGLPDPCRAVPGSQAERWADLADIFFAAHPPTPANMIAWAAQAGWTVEIREQRDFVAGVSMAGDVCGECDFVWVVTILGEVINYFRAGENVSGDLLFTFPDIATLECVLRRAAPAHTRVFFVVPP